MKSAGKKTKGNKRRNLQDGCAVQQSELDQTVQQSKLDQTNQEYATKLN